MVAISVIITLWAVAAVALIITAFLINARRKSRQAELIASATRGHQVWHSGYKRGRAYHHVALFVRNYKYELRCLPSGKMGFKTTEYNRPVDFKSFDSGLHAQDTFDGATLAETEEDGSSYPDSSMFGSFGVDFGGSKDGYQILLIGHTDKTHAEIEAIGKSLGDTWVYHLLLNNCQTFTKKVAEKIVNAYGRTPMWPVAFSENNGAKHHAFHGHAGVADGGAASTTMGGAGDSGGGNSGGGGGGGGGGG